MAINIIGDYYNSIKHSSKTKNSILTYMYCLKCIYVFVSVLKK